MENKQAKTSIVLIFFVFFAFFMLVFYVALIYGFTTFDNVARQIDINVSGQNFSQIYNATLGRGITTTIDVANDSALLFILGMVVVMSLFGYAARENQKLWFILDLFILFVAMILGIYMSRAYNTYINADAGFLNIASTNFQTASTLILNLPFIIPAIWLIIVVITYGLTRKPEGGSIGIGY